MPHCTFSALPTPPTDRATVLEPCHSRTVMMRWFSGLFSPTSARAGARREKTKNKKRFAEGPKGETKASPGEISSASQKKKNKKKRTTERTPEAAGAPGAPGAPGPKRETKNHASPELGCPSEVKLGNPSTKHQKHQADGWEPAKKYGARKGNQRISYEMIKPELGQPWIQGLERQTHGSRKWFEAQSHGPGKKNLPGPD